MQATLRKLNLQHGLITLPQEDGSCAMWLCDNDAPLPRDLVRWVAVVSLGARGRRAEDTGGPTAQQLDAVVESLHHELWSGGVASNDFWPTLQAACEVRGVPQPPWLSEQHLEVMRRGLLQACDGWAQLGVDDVLRLKYQPAQPRDPWVR